MGWKYEIYLLADAQAYYTQVISRQSQGVNAALVLRDILIHWLPDGKFDLSKLCANMQDLRGRPGDLTPFTIRDAERLVHGREVGAATNVRTDPRAIALERSVFLWRYSHPKPFYPTKQNAHLEMVSFLFAFESKPPVPSSSSPRLNIQSITGTRILENPLI